METSERPAVVVDVVPRWAVDASFFLAMAVGFLVWGVTLRSAPATILTFAVMAVIAMLLDRMSPVLQPGPALAEANDRPPAGAMRRTWTRYAAGSVVVAAAVSAFLAVLSVLLVPPGFFAGWMTAYCFARLRSFASAREIERTRGIRLSMKVERSVWRKRPPAYYATPRLSV